MKTMLYSLILVAFLAVPAALADSSNPSPKDSTPSKKSLVYQGQRHTAPPNSSDYDPAKPQASIPPGPNGPTAGQ
jgi:hypothetical protein